MKGAAVFLVLAGLAALLFLGPPGDDTRPAGRFSEALLSGDHSRVVMDPALVVFVGELPDLLSDVRLDPVEGAMGRYRVHWNAAGDGEDSGEFEVALSDRDGVPRWELVP